MWVVAAVLLLGCGVGLAAADALPFTGRQAVSGTLTESGPGARAGQPIAQGPTSPDDGSRIEPGAIEAKWNGPAVNLDWTGAEYVRAETSFIGDRIASPGDRVARTLSIVNAGPGDGVLSIAIDVAENTPAGTRNPDLAEDVTLFWDVDGVRGEERFSVLVPRGQTNVAEISLAKGGQVAVSIGYEMARSVETSRSLGAASTQLDFDVDVKLTGDTYSQTRPKLAMTGSTGLLAILGIGLALGLLGLILLAIRRRQPECDDCERPIRRGDHWVKSHDSHGMRKIQCESCHIAHATP